MEYEGSFEEFYGDKNKYGHKSSHGCYDNIYLPYLCSIVCHFLSELLNISLKFMSVMKHPAIAMLCAECKILNVKTHPFFLTLMLLQKM